LRAHERPGGLTMKAIATAVPLVLATSSAYAADEPTFSRDVLPLLQKHCQTCHRPGEIGPMPLLTYEQVRPYARAIKRATEAKKMPPWFADSSVQHYSNDTSLSAAEIALLGTWSDAGAPEGNPGDAPPIRLFSDGWNIVDAGKAPDKFGDGKPAPKGTRLELVGTWDNSAANRHNPDPTAAVKWGDQSWEEMLLSMVTLAIDPKADVTALFETPPRRPAGSQTTRPRTASPGNR
jgi:hypothetical protein